MTEHADPDVAWAYFDGGPATGYTLEQRAPHWAPLPVLHVQLDGVDIPYVLAEQPTPLRGQAWRYVPDDGSSSRAPSEGQARDPFDD